MDNVINPTLQVLPSVSAADKAVMIDIVRLPSNIKVGDMILLETLMNSGTATPGNTEPSVLLNILDGNQKIPLEPKNGLPLKFDASAARQFVAKVVSENTLLLMPDKKLPSAQTLPEHGAAVVKETNVSLPQARLTPLSGQQITALAMKELNFPQPLQNRITAQLPPSVVAVRIENPAASAVPDNGILQPLKTALQDLAAALTGGAKPQIAAAREQVTQALQNLVAQKFVAVPQTNGGTEVSAPVRQLESPLGKITVETPLKLPPQTGLELSVSDVKTEMQNPLPADALQKIFARPEIAELFPQADSRNLLHLLQNRDTAVVNLLKVFEPLRELPQLALPVLQKLPSFNQSILSNLHAFYKGAVEQDAKAWLGAETFGRLQAEGVKGQAALQNLQEFTVAALRETPSWRMIEMPLFDGAQLIPFKLAVKKDPDSEGDKTPRRKSGGTRFVIDTDFSKLGAFQLDGFSVPRERRLDLVVRTSKRHSEDFCAHIINLFKTSLYAVNYIGTIAVNQKQAFVNPEADGPARLPEGVFI